MPMADPRRRRRRRWRMPEMRAAPAMTDRPTDTPAVVTVPALLSVATVARLLDCSAWTVRRRIHDGDLPAINDHGRLAVRGDDLRAYVDALERVGARPSRPTPRGRTYDFLR
jgi:excisionase family DNA binding protein